MPSTSTATCVRSRQWTFSIAHPGPASSGDDRFVLFAYSTLLDRGGLWQTARPNRIGRLTAQDNHFAYLLPCIGRYSSILSSLPTDQKLALKPQLTSGCRSALSMISWFLISRCSRSSATS